VSLFVLDASVALAWCFRDEATPETDALAVRANSGGFVVPPLWHLEVANILVGSERRGRATPLQVQSAFALLEKFKVETDERGGDRLSDAIGLARHHRLTVYDATYLELAIRRNAPLATLDKALVTAARQVGLTVLP